MRRSIAWLICIIGGFTLALTAAAPAAEPTTAPTAEAAPKPFLDPLFSNDMVLQREVPDPVWGWADPGAQVTVSMNGKSDTATAGADGKWMAKIGPFEAGGPFDLTVSAGSKNEKLTNVLVGDVWVCSGQSNMEFGIGRAINAEKEIAAADHPQMRLFMVPKQVATEPQDLFKGSPSWLVCSPENVAKGGWNGFSAVGYFFGRDLQKELNIPIGLIGTYWGGTICEAWTSREALQQNMPDLRASLTKVIEPAPTGKDKKLRDNPNEVTVLFNGMVNPLVPFAIKGAIWYQGESNAGRPMQYRRLLPTMIGDWRSRFGVGDFPFFIVELANFRSDPPQPAESLWAELREAQILTASSVGHSAIASAIDIGDAKDIHPKNKQEVGRRLALDALALVYDQSAEYSGPTFQSMEKKDNALSLHFTHAQGLQAKGGEPLKGFAVAGPDKHFVWADAKIDNDMVIVSAKDVTDPQAVRYDWGNNPDGNLYNQAGLPATPFRTDSPKTEEPK
jgi:sialate O-acetylesterase